MASEISRSSPAEGQPLSPNRMAQVSDTCTLPQYQGEQGP